MKSDLLLVDGIIDIFVGLAITIFPIELTEMIGLPYPENPFYLIMLGSLLTGLGVAILIEFFNPSLKGLGLCGSVAINVCAVIVLAVSLLTGVIELPFRAKIMTIILIAILVILSGAKLVAAEITNNSCVGRTCEKKENESKEITKNNY